MARRENTGESIEGTMDPLVIKVTADELKRTEEGKILVELYKRNAFGDRGLKLDDLSDVGDTKVIGNKLRKFERLGFVKKITPLIGKQKYYCLTELGRRIAEEILNLTASKETVEEQPS
jgi:DNA-binding HxlR family transcriptional regulator